MRYLFFILLFSLSAFSSERIDLSFSDKSTKQGAILSALLKLESDSAQTLDLQKLKGTTLGKTLYFHSISPLLRKEGARTYEAEAKVIFIHPPKDVYLQDKFQGKDVTVAWNPIAIQEIQAQKGFIFAQFDVPSRPKIILWSFIFLGVLVTVVLLYKGLKIYSKKKLIKEQKLKIKNEIFNASSFDEIVIVWKKKRGYLEVFPYIETSFLKFEGTLFKYQFKPRQTLSEIEEVKKAYETFLNEIRGGFDGI